MGVISGRVNSSLGDLIQFSYQVQTKQIVNPPEWMNKDRYDIGAVPEQEGVPNPEQVRIMIRKLLADRFKLTFHQDKKELSAYLLTVANRDEAYSNPNARAIARLRFRARHWWVDVAGNECDDD